MMKATLRSAVLLGLLAWSVPAFAEVQNVRVGGDVNVRGFARHNMRLSEDVFTDAGQVDDVKLDFGSAHDYFLQQLTAVNVGADLTENVATNIRLINQGVWGSQNDQHGTGTATLSLANITLKELFYSPLTVTVGRQPLWFGRGFIVGNRLMNGDNDTANNLAADEYSDLTAFDAIHATLDLNGAAAVDLPVVVDLVWAKVAEGSVSAQNSTSSASDDTNLWGINLGTKFDSTKGEAEIYWFDKSSHGVAVLNSKDKPNASTIGMRGSASPMEGSSVWGEIAYQWGHRITSAITYDAEGAAGDGYQAWAMNLGGDYTASGAPWSPTVGAEWVFFSGDDGAPGTSGSAIGGWDPMYRGRFFSALRDFQGAGFYLPAQSGATIGGTFLPITNATTNQHILALHGTVKPIEDLSIDNRFSWFTADKGIRPTATSKRRGYFGAEWDVQAKYNYTDDVQLAAVWGLFMPGDVFRDPYDSAASELVTSVNVKF